MTEKDVATDPNMNEIFRYWRGDEVRVYHLVVTSGGVELWRVVKSQGQADSSVKETGFKGLDEAGQFLEEVQRTLTAGGWRPV